MKKIRSIYYFIMYGSLMKNYEVYYKLDILLVYLKEVGIKTIIISNDKYRGTIIFNDNTKFSFWNANRWYAWMSSGEIIFSNGKTLNWDMKMPKSEVLYKFKKVIKAYEKISKITDNAYSDLLPIKVQRKRKLNRIKELIGKK